MANKNAAVEIARILLEFQIERMRDASKNDSDKNEQQENEQQEQNDNEQK